MPILQKTLEPLAPEAAARLTAFARACKAAARAVTLYPATHPSLRVALANIVAASSPAGSNEPLALMIMPDDIVLGGRHLDRADLAVTELAVLLHAHAVGELIVLPGTDAELWRAFLLLIAEPSEEVRGRGGIAKVWASEPRPGIQVREIDYGAVLKDRSRGESQGWTAIVANCLQGGGVELDDNALDILLDILRSPDRLGDLTSLVNEHAAGAGEAGGHGFANLLGAIAGYTSQAHPDRLDSVYSTMADAAGRLSVDMLLQLLAARQQPGGEEPTIGRIDVATEIVARMSDTTVSQFVAKSIISGRGASARLADAFQALVPGEDRQDDVLSLAKGEVESSDVGRHPEFDDLWHRAEKLLKSYSDRKFVSEDYGRELSSARTRAVDLEHTSEDPPDRIAAWLATIDETSVRGLDAELLLDLLEVEVSPMRWRELSEVASARISDLVIIGDFSSAHRLAAALKQHEHEGGDPARQPAAQEAIEHLLAGSVMRHVASHFERIDEARFEQAKQFCYTLGTIVIKPLAEVLASEERAQPRERLRDLLLGFGAAGRQSVEQLKQSPNPSVRRTAIYLLREFGGNDALPDLESLLDDAEPHVQREAIRAILMIATDAGYAALARALATGSARSRSGIMNVLAGLRDERAPALFSYIVRKSSHRGAMQQPYHLAVESLGRLGGHEAVDSLKDALGRGEWWSPFATPALRTAVAAALAKIGTPEAWHVLDDAAVNGPRGVRIAARAQLAGPVGKRRRQREASPATDK